FDHHLHALHSFPTRRSSDLVAAQSFDATADARKRSTGALSSTSRTRRVSGGISPVSLSCVAVLLVTDCLLGSGREPVRLFCPVEDRKSTRLNSSHEWISYAV